MELKLSGWEPELEWLAFNNADREVRQNRRKRQNRVIVINVFVEN